MNSRELKKLLETMGCKFYRQGKGSHEIWINKEGKKMQIPHPKKKLGEGLLKKIMKWAE
ncbi:type II toxin-antitoxin system HicA family toxin [Endozoicomonas ascidiicola]|uniref:type II toxin-antitoxin system HicA family toxin n=1 Tax=Endozoicomonas ascidiicola TaxID=1698521 RepID=UPI000A60A9DC|nr:type II toxin-antitoxin system HicA family toxin [Endozoicomonas ascidiicola]